MSAWLSELAWLWTFHWYFLCFHPHVVQPGYNKIKQRLSEKSDEVENDDNQAKMEQRYLITRYNLDWLVFHKILHQKWTIKNQRYNDYGKEFEP